MSSPLSLLDLPPEIISHTFSYLPIADLSCCYQVSRYFKQLSGDSLPANLMMDYVFCSSSVYPPPPLLKKVKWFQALTYRQLNETQVLSTLPHTSPFTRRLYVSRCAQLSSGGWLQIFQHFHHLQKLNVAHSSFSNQNLLLTAKLCPSLKKLNLKYTFVKTALFDSCRQKPLFPGLTHLKMNLGCLQAKALPAKLAQANLLGNLAKNCPKLAHLILNASPWPLLLKTKSENLSSPPLFPHLKQLHLKESQLINSHLRIIAKHCPALLSLKIQQNNLDDRAWAKDFSLPHLDHLNIERCSFSEGALNEIAQKCCKLTHLFFSENCLSRQQGEKYSQTLWPTFHSLSFPKLTTLSLSQADFSHPRSLRSLAKSSPNLNQLLLVNCRIDGAAYRALSKRPFLSLNHLQQAYCSLKKIDWKKVDRALPHLQTLDLYHSQIKDSPLKKRASLFSQLLELNLVNCTYPNISAFLSQIQKGNSSLQRLELGSKIADAAIYEEHAQALQQLPTPAFPFLTELFFEGINLESLCFTTLNEQFPALSEESYRELKQLFVNYYESSFP